MARWSGLTAVCTTSENAARVNHSGHDGAGTNDTNVSTAVNAVAKQSHSGHAGMYSILAVANFAIDAMTAETESHSGHAGMEDNGAVKNAVTVSTIPNAVAKHSRSGHSGIYTSSVETDAATLSTVLNAGERVSHSGHARGGRADMRATLQSIASHALARVSHPGQDGSPGMIDTMPSMAPNAAETLSH